MNRFIIMSIISIAAGFQAMADIYDRAMIEMIENNPQVKALVAEDESRLQQLKSENNLPATDVEFEHIWGTGGIGTKWGLSVSQTFDYPGLYKVRGDVARASGDAYASLRKNAMLDKLLETKLALIELVYNRHMEDMLTVIHDNMRELRDNCRKAYTNGEGTILDVNKSEIELVRMERRLALCHGDMETAKAVLLSMGVSQPIIDEADSYPLENIAPLEEYEAMLDNNPMLAYYTQMANVERLNGKIAGLGNIPGISIGFRHDYELGESFNGFTVGLSLPFFSNRHKKAVARAASVAAGFQKKAAHIEAEVAMTADYRNVVELRELVSGLAAVFEQNNHPALLMRAWRGGEINVLTYIQESVYFMEAQAEYIEAMRDYYVALARLNKFQLLLKNFIG